jgi:hypothetical protein
MTQSCHILNEKRKIPSLSGSYVIFSTHQVPEQSNGPLCYTISKLEEGLENHISLSRSHMIFFYSRSSEIKQWPIVLHNR